MLVRGRVEESHSFLLEQPSRKHLLLEMEVGILWFGVTDGWSRVRSLPPALPIPTERRPVYYSSSPSKPNSPLELDCGNQTGQKGTGGQSILPMSGSPRREEVWLARNWRSCVGIFQEGRAMPDLAFLPQGFKTSTSSPRLACPGPQTVVFPWIPGVWLGASILTLPECVFFHPRRVLCRCPNTVCGGTSHTTALVN